MQCKSADVRWGKKRDICNVYTLKQRHVSVYWNIGHWCVIIHAPFNDRMKYDHDNGDAADGDIIPTAEADEKPPTTLSLTPSLTPSSTHTHTHTHTHTPLSRTHTHTPLSHTHTHTHTILSFTKIPSKQVPSFSVIFPRSSYRLSLWYNPSYLSPSLHVKVPLPCFWLFMNAPSYVSPLV